MISYLRGKFLTRSEDEIVIDVNGVGYAVSATSGVLLNSPAPGGELSVVVYTDVKENSISLFGFASQLEKEVFLLLKKVSGIGSKTALNMVSGIGPEDLLKAIGRSDTSALTRISGVGKKTAERVLVELRERVGELIPKGGSRPSAGSYRDIEQPSGDPLDDVVLALEKLGFNYERARSAVGAVAKEGGVRNTEDLLREALSQLS